MRKRYYSNECVGCESCVGCGRKKVETRINRCDECNSDEDTLYEIDGKELCAYCASKAYKESLSKEELAGLLHNMFMEMQTSSEIITAIKEYDIDDMLNEYIRCSVLNQKLDKVAA